VLVVVPAHDEHEALPGVLREIHAALPGVDVLVVDDGSRDGSGAVAAAHGATVLTHPQNRGYGAALVSGYRHAIEHGYDLVLTIDGDGQHDPADARLFEAAGTADVVIGSRMLEPSRRDAVAAAARRDPPLRGARAPAGLAADHRSDQRLHARRRRVLRS
jgi:glycosyltransferase involved in cell wall biosynthesis